MDTGWMLSAFQALLGKGGWLSHKLFLHCHFEYMLYSCVDRDVRKGESEDSIQILR